MPQGLQALLGFLKDSQQLQTIAVHNPTGQKMKLYPGQVMGVVCAINSAKAPTLVADWVPDNDKLGNVNLVDPT